MPSLEIREISDADLQGIVTLWQRCGLTRPWNDPATDIAFARDNDNATLLVGILSDRVVASVLVGHDGHRGGVYYVAVDPEQRREGLGRDIMTAAEDWLRARGVWKLNLMVRADNAPVANFYSQIGYEPEERIVLSKWIDPSKKPDR